MAAVIRTRKITNLVYQYVLHVRIGGSQEQAQAWFRRKYNVAPAATPGTNAVLFSAHNEKSHVIWFEQDPIASLCAHEALHSVVHVFKECGMGSLCDANEEAFSYLIQWTVQKIMGE